MRLFYAPGACSLASHIALEDAGADFEPVAIDFGSAQQQSAEYLAINPKGRVPALEDGGEVVTESPAILRYIARRFPEANLWPADVLEDARCAEWLSWCVSSVHVAFSHIARSYRYAISADGLKEVEEKGRETTRDMWAQVEARLAARTSRWAASDDFSVADPYLFTFWHWGRNPRLDYEMARDFPGVDRACPPPVRATGSQARARAGGRPASLKHARMYHGRIRSLARTADMALGYWISIYRSSPNPELIARYSKLAGPIVKAAGGRVLTAGAPVAAFEHGMIERTVIIEFDSPELARATFESEAYQEAASIINGSAIRDVRIVSGV